MTGCELMKTKEDLFEIIEFCKKQGITRLSLGELQIDFSAIEDTPRDQSLRKLTGRMHDLNAETLIQKNTRTGDFHDQFEVTG